MRIQAGMKWTTGTAAFVLVVALGGCASMQGGRDRLVKRPAPCQDQSVAIYFEPNSAELTTEGRAVIDLAAGYARNCRVDRVEVLGLADAAGAPEANLELSKRRAQAVTAALATAGLPDAEFRLAAAGDVGAVTEEGAAQPLRRRADVVLHVKPRK